MDLHWRKLWNSPFIYILWIVCLTLEKVPGSYGIDLSILPAGVGQLIPSRSGVSRRSVEDVPDGMVETSLTRPERGVSDTPNSLANEIVCTSVEINSLVGNLVERLGNCTVIEGNLAIGPIDDHDPKYPWESVSFPNLRVVGLKSLRDVFPNLAVVRGGRLVRNSAFVIFENKELRDIGLPSLVAVRRGGVFVRKNPSLCYVDTIDWNRITNGDLTNSAKENGDPIKCGSMCDPGCDAYQPRCWTQHPGDCQKVLPRICGNDPTASGCCHANCLSGCYGTSRNECITCRAVHFDGACMETCPAYTYMYGDRRCLSEDMCRNISAGRNKMKAVNGLCTTECPTHYTVDPLDAGRCIPCGKSCPKVCEGNYNVNTVDGTIQLKTCTIINGSLDIQIGSGDQIVKALEDNLKNIEEVRDYVKVVRSHSVVSLNFLKNMRLIRGERLATGYALSVLDNQHLQDLFDFSGIATDPDHTPRRSLQVLNGNIGFHYNPRLCLNKIYAFVAQATNRTDTKDPRDISTSSNGDRIACDIQKIDLLPMTVATNGAMLQWKAFELDDTRSLLGYVLSYRESPGRNLTKFDGRDECAGDLWTRMDLDPQAEGMGSVYAVLTDLKPARQYAAYVSTYTIATEQQGGQSDIIYFTTKSARPYRPVLVQTEAINTTAIRVFWRPPTEANGKIVNYNIVYQPAGEEDTRLRSRNYCTSRIPEKKDYYNLNVLTTTPTPDTCPCNDTDSGGAKKHVKVLEKDHEELINMENQIQDLAFVKSVISRAKREVPSSDTMFMDLRRVRRQAGNTTTVVLNGNSTVSTIQSDNSTAADSNNITTPTSVAVTTPDPRMYRTAYETSYVIRDLHHFTDYVIWVEACHAPTSDYTPCSEKTLASPSQTRPLKGADDIPSSSVHLSLESLDNTTASTGRYVHVTWADPLDPNGVIITVDIEWQLMDGKNSEPGKKCVPRTQNADPRASILFEHQHSGNYSFRLQASSFAGNGSWTEPRYIYIEKKLLPQTGLAPSVVGGIVAGVVLGLAIIFGAVFWYFYKRNKKLPGGPDLVSVNPDYYCYKPDEWEVPRENIELGRELGTGTFGKVYEGIAKNIVAGVDRLIVAIKTVNEDKSPAERSFFLQEASIMKSFRCHHVVKLLGVVSEGQPVLVIMEYMAHGDLKTWLRNQRPDEDHPDQKPPLFSRLLQMAGEICDGMAYIQSKKFVHRDLAARNCMIAEDLTVKIGDFGMTRDVYETDYYRKGGKGLLPVRWMAPESLKDGLFTNESDVWSFGVVLWEIATLAAQPYQGLANEEVLHFVVDGRLMPKPENCPNRIYDMMKRCWSFQPHNRPTFLQMVEELLPDLDEKFRQVSYFSTVDFNDVSPYTRDNEPSAGHELKDLGNRVISLLRDPETRDEEDESETDLLLVRPEPPTLPTSQSQSRLPPVNDGIRDQSPSLDPVVIVHQNGGSQASSQDGSKGMAINFPTKDGPGKLPNGGVNGVINKLTNLT